MKKISKIKVKALAYVFTDRIIMDNPWYVKKGKYGGIEFVFYDKRKTGLALVNQKTLVSSNIINKKSVTYGNFYK